MTQMLHVSNNNYLPLTKKIYGINVSKYTSPIRRILGHEMPILPWTLQDPNITAGEAFPAGLDEPK